MNTNAQKHIVIFDGECGVCQFFKEKAESRDFNQQLKFIPFQTADLGNLSPGLSEEMAAKSIYFIHISGERFQGAEAFFEVMKRLKGIWSILGRIFALPLFAYIAEPFYRIFARNRMHISRWFGLQHCAVKFPQRKS